MGSVKAYEAFSHERCESCTSAFGAWKRKQNFIRYQSAHVYIINRWLQADGGHVRGFNEQKLSKGFIIRVADNLLECMICIIFIIYDSISYRYYYLSIFAKLAELKSIKAIRLMRVIKQSVGGREIMRIYGKVFFRRSPRNCH